MKLRLTLISLLLAFCLSSQGEDSIPVLRPVTSSYTFEMGNAHLADTYLTPLHYRGTHLGIAYERNQAMKGAQERWIMQLKVSSTLDKTLNQAKNSTLLSADFNAAWAAMHRWRLPQSITLGVGPGVAFNAGVLYMSRNSNNPASAKCSLTLDATGYVSWTGKIWRVPLTLRYQPTLPLTGAFFSPDYGELYYQIYLGQHDGLMHAAWPGNFFSLDNLLTADLHFGNTSLRIGYHNHILSSKTNDIVTQNITHALVLGITTEWISLRPNDKQIHGRIISSY